MMKNLVIEKTNENPEVNFQVDGQLSIKGVSTVNNAQKFYSKALEWLHSFKETHPKKIDLIMEMYYLNTSSTLMFVDLIRVLNSFKSLGTEVQITWKYEDEDEDILNLGEDIETSTDSKFEYKIIPL